MLDALEEVVKDELGNAQKVRIGGLVQLTVRVKPAQKKRVCRMPHTCGGEPPASFLHRRQSCLRFRERPGAQVNARRLGRDRDLLAGRRVAALALVCCSQNYVAPGRGGLRLPAGWVLSAALG